MSSHPQTDPPAGRLSPWRKRIGRVVRRTLYVKLSAVFVLACLLGAFYLRLLAGPLSLEGYTDGVAQALAARIGPGWSVSMKDTTLELYGARPALRAMGLDIRNPAGARVVSAPYAIVSLDPMSLLTGTISPRAIELRDLRLRASVAADGRLSFARASDDASANGGAPDAVSLPADGATGSPVSVAVSSLLDQVLGATGLVGALDAAAVTGARLTLVGVDGRERVAFNRVDARFARVGAHARRIDVELAGPHGDWRVGGNAREDGEGARHAELGVTDVPLEDVMLLAGLAPLPAGSDVKLSGHLSVTTDGSRLTRLVAGFAGANGTIARPGQASIRIDRIGGDAAWKEDARRLDLTGLDAKSGATAFKLSGSLTQAGAAGWKLALSGENATVAAAGPAEPPVRIGSISADVDLGAGRLALDHLSLRGDQLDLTVSGAAAPGGGALRAMIEAKDTDVRRLFAFWPDMLLPDLRGYLVENLRRGRLDWMKLDADLDPQDVRALSTPAPLSPNALQLGFHVSSATLQAADGMPPLTGLEIDGRATPARILLTSQGGAVEMPDGRRLAFVDGSFDQSDPHRADSIAQIRFGLTGGADALASLIRSPALRTGQELDVDPADVHGRADLRVSLPLAMHHIPAPADLPIKVAGTLADLAVDKVMGPDKFEAGNFSVAYEDGVLTAHGTGKVDGQPATVDLRKPRNGKGDLSLATSLDDAARARRGLPVAPQLVGAVPVKATMPLLDGGPGPIRVEADLSRAAVDNLLPGWTKAAGKPGRLSFTMNGAGGRELGDLALDAGTVQLRGRASLGPNGSLDKAEIQSLKLSPGDDLKVRLDRTGPVLRIALSGNVGDARPVMRWLAQAPRPRTSSAHAREPGDVDLDASVNILTGENDEALTGFAANVSVRNGELRALKLSGRFRSAPLEARLQARDGLQPVLKIRSEDAGATLRFVDFYKRMIGGSLVAEVGVGGASEPGSVVITSFGLRNEPALRRIAAQGGTIANDDNAERADTRLPQLDAGQVHFTKLTGEFTRRAQRIDYKDVVIWGPQVGFTLSGYVDYGRDRTDITGTFIPAYGLNNAFSQVPVIGLLLGGGRNEGLFAVDFRVSGAATSPTMTINPLSAVAPGILRKIFGLMTPAAESPATTGATARDRPDP